MTHSKERVRFELTEPVSSSDFKSDAIDHSAISPRLKERLVSLLDIVIIIPKSRTKSIKLNFLIINFQKMLFH